MSAATARRRQLVRLLQAIHDATAAIDGMDDSPGLARWLAYRAATYRRVAAHPDIGHRGELARAAARVDELHAARIRTSRKEHE